MSEFQCPDYPSTPCRVNLELMPDPTWTWMVLLTLVAVGIFGYGVWQMVHVWRLGTSWKPGHWKAGLKRLVVGLATHRKFMQDKRPGTSHAWMFYGFAVLFIGTTLAAIDMDFFELILKKKLLFGTGYLLYEAFLDFFGLLFLMGVTALAVRRYKERPPQLKRTKSPEAPWLSGMNGDLYALVFLGLIGITGFILEGIRLQYQIQVDGITYARYSFVGNTLGLIMAKSGLSLAQMQAAYPALWWLHFALWSSVLAILPWTKLKHILTSSLNLYFHDDDRQARANLPTPFSLQEVMESGDTDSMGNVGYSNIRDFSWKDRLALDACTNCGRCEAQCPAFAAGRPLSPRKLIQDLKAHMWEDYREGKQAGSANHTPVKLTDVGNLDLRTQVEEATLWSCTTCRACMTECPVDIEHVDLIVEMRRGLVMESKLDEHQSKLLVNLTNAGNPYGFPNVDRDAWTQALPAGVKVPSAQEKAAAGESIDLLWWVGCVGSFDPRNNQVTSDLAKILNAADVDFAILGREEKCTGDPARRLGEEGRFQQSVIENLMVLQQYGVKKILTQCPHCFNTLLNEYPEFGGEFEVIHHTEYIEQLIDEGRLPLKDGAEMKVSFHDSCYLGRHNGIFDAPRRVLEKTNGGLPVLEMAQSKEQGLCCGAGGSNMWYEIKDEDQRINVIRAKQAADTGADTVVSACPFCLTMLKDGISLTGNDEKMVAEDLAEVVARNLDWNPPEPEVPDEPEEGGEEEEKATTGTEAPAAAANPYADYGGGGWGG